METPSSQRKAFSAEAESLVARELARQGWTVLARNFRYIGTELDLVARKGQSLVAVEVKARRRMPRSLAEAEGLLPWRKRAALHRGLQSYVMRRGSDAGILRIDLAIVVPGRSGLEMRYFAGV